MIRKLTVAVLGLTVWSGVCYLGAVHGLEEPGAGRPEAPVAVTTESTVPVQAPTDAPTALALDTVTTVTDPVRTSAVPVSVAAVERVAATVEPSPASAPSEASATGRGETPTCYEEDPCWDCSTMGNGICGPTATDTPAPDAYDHAESGAASWVPAADVVHEEDEGWDCTTMGNRQCGPAVELPVEAAQTPTPAGSYAYDDGESGVASWVPATD